MAVAWLTSMSAGHRCEVLGETRTRRVCFRGRFWVVLGCWVFWGIENRSMVYVNYIMDRSGFVQGG